MMEFIKKITGNTQPTERKDDFSEFFTNASSKEKTKVIRQVMREATEEQRSVVEKYKGMVKPI
jgi:hypothetical protein